MFPQAYISHFLLSPTPFTEPFMKITVLGLSLGEVFHLQSLLKGGLRKKWDIGSSLNSHEPEQESIQKLRVSMEKS